MALRPFAIRDLTLSAALLATASLSACKTSNGGLTQLSETEIRSFEDELGMKPGVGFEGVLEDVRGNCVEFDGIEPTGNSQEAIFSVHLVESHRELTGQLGISAAMQVKAAIPDGNIPSSRKAKFGLGNTFSINRYSAYVLVSARVRNEASLLKNARVKADLKAQVEANPAAALGQFRTQCGDSFLNGFSTGGEFHALIEIKADTDEATAGIKANYTRQGNGGPTTTGAMESNLAGLTSNRQIRIWTYQRGGAGEEQVGLVTSVDELMRRLKGLADSVKNGQNPRPLTATFTDYMTLSLNLPTEYRQKLSAAKSVVQDMAGIQSQLLDLQANLDFILTQPQNFIGVNGAKLAQINETKKDIERRVKQIVETGKACAVDYVNCKAPDGLGVPEFDLPRRKPTLESLQQERLKIKTTLHYVNVDALYDGWFNPPECYVLVNAGKGDSQKIPLRRTETTYGPNRCSNLQTELSIPVTIVKDAYNQLGVGIDRGWIEVELWEDDPSYDDFIGSTWLYFRDLQNGAQLKGINNSNVNLDAGFEIEY